ncbi:MAG: hypothetical protein M3280_00735 [Actinomycetota bacterium]|nr:hypothetical protein [Actinomycetota bacterium]
MATRLSRIAVGLTVLAFFLWLGRLLAHAKVPPPEGRWRELDQDLLNPS